MKFFNFCFLIFVFLQIPIQAHLQCDSPSYDDPLSQNGFLESMNIPCAWTITNGDPSIAVLVYDNYLSKDHPDLVDKVIEIIEGPFGCPEDDGHENHGIQSLGAIAGIRDNRICIAGSGGDTKVSGYCEAANNSTLLDGMNRGYKIMSISHFGGISKSTMETLTDNEVTVLIAGLRLLHQASNPSGYHSVPGVIHVGRAKRNGSFWEYTQGGPGPNMNMDVLAVCENMGRIFPSHTCENVYEVGTSLGTPVIAGVVALMKSVNPCLFPGDIEEILVETAAPSPDVATRSGVIDAYAAVLMAQNFQGFDKEWSGNQTISTDQVSGDLRVVSGSDIILTNRLKTGANTRITIEGGAKLTITGRVEMGEAARFIVERGAELVVDGGVITTGDCANQWEGIVVEGNAEAIQQLPGNVSDTNRNGVVHLMNGALLENAHTFINMNPIYIDWPETPSFYGGHVTASNTTFRNTNTWTNYSRVAAFMQYRGRDRSSFTDCTIENVSAGMTHWSVNGVTYDNCNFSNYEELAILSHDSAVKVINGNVFDNGTHDQTDQAAIDLYQTFPIPIGTQIGDEDSSPNRFFGGFHSVFSEGGNPVLESIGVVNNIFTGGERSIVFHGISNHHIKNNDMIGPTRGVEIAANGNEIFNTMTDNQFSSHDIGLFSFSNNMGFDFLSNCFDYTNFNDVRVHGGGIRSSVGSMDIAASNIFSAATTRNIRVTTSPAFDYWILSGTPDNDRRVPRGTVDDDVTTSLYPGNIKNSIAQIDPSCGSTSSPGPININPIKCELPASKEDLEDFITKLDKEIITLGSEIVNYEFESLQWYRTKYRITEILRCLQMANDKLIFLCGKGKDYTSLISRYSSDKFLYKTYVYGMMVSNGDYNDARQYLNSLRTETEEESDFKTVQLINVDRLQNNIFEANSSDLSTLYTIGKKVYPMSAYARSLYKYFTGEKLELDTEIGKEGIKSRSIAPEENEVIVYPNPSRGTLELDYKISEQAKLSVYSRSGTVLKEVSLDANIKQMELDLTHLPDGIYILLVRTSETGELIHEDKMVIIK